MHLMITQGTYSYYKVPFIGLTIPGMPLWLKLLCCQHEYITDPHLIILPLNRVPVMPE